MSGSRTAGLPWRRRRDRWGLRPVRAGRVRGQIRNLHRSFETCEFGQVIVFDFELFVDDAMPPVPVRMAGMDFQNEPRDGNVVDVRDPSPTVRPIEAIRLDFPPRYQHDVVSFYPGRDEPPPARQWMQGALIILGPILLAAGLLGLYFVLYG
ncbi:MAG: hypothetical protein M0Z28_33155 [Rhodospirillales bacterium]|nr:hypothetical protein [Rhodospirillales bacterium]